MRQIAIAILLGAVLVTGCNPPASRDRVAANQSSDATAQRTLSVVLRVEPFDLTDSASSRNRITLAMFGAGLVYMDHKDVPFPVLSEAVPQLNTDTWQVLPDGKMETTYRLRSGLVWHDGTPLTSEDLVFTRRANAARMDWGLSVSSISPIEERAIEAILAPDPRTVVFRWRQPYPDAVVPEFKTLPRHILEPVLDQGSAELFGSHSYWTSDYVGLGPYRLARWEPGAFLEGVAFEHFALGKPRIERIRVTWSGDPNATLARLLAGDADIAVDEAIKFQQAAMLQPDWVQRGTGVLLINPSNLRKLDAQHRAAHANPAAILNPVVRRATMHAIDRAALAEAMLAGEGIVADSIAPPMVSYFQEVERAIPKYPYDLRRTEALMAEAGFVKRADGPYASATEGRFTPEVLGVSEGQEGQETTILADYLKQAGMDTQLRLVTAAQMQQSDETKATYPTWRTNNHYTTATRALSANRMLGRQAATLENRWGGTNKSGWNNADHDRLFDAWNRALDRDERTRLMVEIIKLTAEELPFLPLYFSSNVVAHVSTLRGPESPGIETMIHGNVHEWHWATR